MTAILEKNISDASDMLVFGSELAKVCPDNIVIFLYGDLGAGKTTLVRGFLRGLGYAGPVKSPTYTIVESYVVNERQVFHFDLYRVHDPRELEFIGIQDYFSLPALCLIEWPERGLDWLPSSDLSCYIAPRPKGGRSVRMTSETEAGRELIERIAKR